MGLLTSFYLGGFGGVLLKCQSLHLSLKIEFNFCLLTPFWTLILIANKIAILLRFSLSQHPDCMP